MVEDRVAATREAVGPDVDIIIENHSQLDALSAIQIARATEKYNIFFFEEPNTPTPKTARYIRDNINIPIANGERIFGRWQYAPYFEDMTIQVAQPDLTSCGGLTEGKKICDMAHTYDIGVQAHVCGTPLSTALSLHLECSIPNFVIHEHHCNNLHACIIDLCVHDYQPVNGKLPSRSCPHRQRVERKGPRRSAPAYYSRITAGNCGTACGRHAVPRFAYGGNCV